MYLNSTNYSQSPKCHISIYLLALCTWGTLASFPIDAQELHSAAPAESIGPAQRLAVEQIDALIDAQKLKDVVTQVQILNDMPPALIERSVIQAAATQFVQPYEPLGEWCQHRLKQSLLSDSQLQIEYEKQWNVLANSALRAIQKSKNPADAREAIRRYGATNLATTLANLLVDLQFENGDFLAGIQLMDTQFPEFSRIPLRQLDPKASAVSVPWYRAWQSLSQDPRLADPILQHWSSVSRDQPQLTTELLIRLLTAAALDPQHLDYEAISQWVKVSGSKLPQAEAEIVSGHLAETRLWFGAADMRAPSSNSGYLYPLNQPPHWQWQLDRWSNGSDLTPATRPAVGQLKAALPYFPIVYEGKVLLHDLTRIRAFHLHDGKPWPPNNPSGVLLDSQISTAAFLPLGYPLQGSPRAGLSVWEGCLYARMGSPVTAWYNRTSSNDGSSLSYLIGLDLEREGIALRGFPLRLTPPEFKDAEFEGTPIVMNQMLITVISERDNVGIRRSLAAFDRFSGQLLWHTNVLGSGVVVGSEGANLISNCQPSVAGGLVYLGTDLGTIACIDIRTGQTVWLSRYQRAHREQDGYPKPNRFRYRNGPACFVHQGLVYCLPQDCAEVFALDALNGDIVWSTDDEEGSDCTYQLGVHGNSLVLGGDRLVWLDRSTGAVLGQFPTRPTPGLVNALPQPRGLGHAVATSDRVYWPTAQQVLVFPADASVYTNRLGTPFVTPPVLQQIESTYCGTEGGNLCAEGPWLLMTTPGRLTCFFAK